MAPFSHFSLMSWSLVAIAAALWIALLKQLGVWRWLYLKAAEWAVRYAGRV